MTGVFQDRGAGAAGDVGAEAHVHAVLQHAAYRKHGVGEVDVRQGTMRNAGTRLHNRRDIRAVDEIAVRQDGASG